MGTDFTAVIGHQLTRETAHELPAFLDRVRSSNSRLAVAGDSLSLALERTSDLDSWRVESYGHDDQELVNLEGPHGLVHVYRHWLAYWNFARYRWGFLAMPGVLAPIRTICRELADSLGVSFVMYLPEWAIDNVVPEEVCLKADADELRQRLIDSGAVLVDLSGVPDDTNLAEFARARSEEGWPYFIETVGVVPGAISVTPRGDRQRTKPCT